jgi:fatty acid desaturase
MRQTTPAVEWPTLLMLAATYSLWALGTTSLYTLFPVVAVILTGVAVAQFSSLQHELLHGHPFRAAWLNEAIGTPALGLTVPYGRFRETHLAHHHDPVLTDPYDDPESNYMDPVVWDRLPGWLRMVFRANNTLVGRILIGSVLGIILWLQGEARLLRQNAPGVRRDWGLHVLGLIPVVAWLWVAAMPWWAYLAAVWIGHALLKVRTFLEHRAHEAARARTVIVEDRGPLALLFLNNNLHVVHHMHPAVPWYALPALYAQNRDHYRRRNDHYVFANYLEVFRRYALRAKDRVPHPLMPGGEVAQAERAEYIAARSQPAE